MYPYFVNALNKLTDGMCSQTTNPKSNQIFPSNFFSQFDSPFDVLTSIKYQLIYKYMQRLSWEPFL